MSGEENNEKENEVSSTSEQTEYVYVMNVKSVEDEKELLAVDQQADIVEDEKNVARCELKTEDISNAVQEQPTDVVIDDKEAPKPIEKMEVEAQPDESAARNQIKLAQSSGSVEEKTSIIDQTVVKAANSSLTVEHLLSILQDVDDKEAPKDRTGEVTASGDQPIRTRKTTKKYVYKLKTKSGSTTLKYVSSVPIVLKKPVIRLDKMKVDDGDEIVDSDNSTKENRRVQPTRQSRSHQAPPRRARAPLKQQPESSAAAAKKHAAPAKECGETSDAGTDYGIRTRKRKLKFLPDGRMVGPSKRFKGSSAEEDSGEETSSIDEAGANVDTSDEDWRASDDERNERNASVAAATAASSSSAVKKAFAERNAKAAKTCGDTPKVATAVKRTAAESGAKKSAPSNGAAQPKSNIDPAQLLSSLIGTTILPSQLQVVRFKPKNVQKPFDMPRESLKKLAAQSAQRRTASVAAANRAAVRKVAAQTPASSTGARTTAANRTSSSFPPAAAESPDAAAASATLVVDPLREIPNFDNFTDSKRVRTREGPKKFAQKMGALKYDPADVPENSVYDLVKNLFDERPSWNLHLMPDTRSFCIGQVARGRLGIPILKKSIELNSEFFAKIYVHQLHCKKFDGIYDTKPKIRSLIRQIDLLSA